MNYQHVPSMVDDELLPVDPADCEQCIRVNNKWCGPCLTHWSLGVEFP